MLISTNTLRSDPRVMCGLIAESTLARLESQERPSAAEVHALTLIRMLDAYRVGMQPVPAHSGVAAYSPLVNDESGFDAPDHQSDVMQAIDTARTSVCKLDREDFSTSMVRTLAAVFSVQGVTAPVDANEVALLKGFLGRFATALQTA